MNISLFKFELPIKSCQEIKCDYFDKFNKNCSASEHIDCLCSNELPIEERLFLRDQKRERVIPEKFQIASPERKSASKVTKPKVTKSSDSSSFKITNSTNYNPDILVLGMMNNI